MKWGGGRRKKSREVKEDGLRTESRPGREGPLERKKGPLVPLGWHPLLIRSDIWLTDGAETGRQTTVRCQRRRLGLKESESKQNTSVAEEGERGDGWTRGGGGGGGGGRR